MTEQNRATLKGYFNTGDTPTEANFADLVDTVLETGEIFVPVAGMWPSTTTGADEPAKTEYTTNDQDLYRAAFDQTASEYMQFNVWMPDNWNAGTVTFKAAWTADSGSGTVTWALQGVSYADDDAIDATWGTAQTSTDTLITAGDMHYSPVSSAITIAGTPAAGELVQFRVYRDIADTLTADAQLIALKIYYTKA